MLKKIDKGQAYEIAKEMGYEQFTALQEKVFGNCFYGENAREFIMGSTSSGKTMIPLVCYKADKLQYEKKDKLLYVVPYRALATQKASDFLKKFPDEHVIVSTSEYCSEDLNVMNANCDMAIVIYEKVFMFLSNNKNFLNQYSYIVFDELGIVKDEERGLKADYILQYACDHTASNVYVLATPYYNWDLYIQRYKFNSHIEESRPVEIVNKEILYHLGSEGMENEEINRKIFEICAEHRKQGHKILVFANSRKRVRELSEQLYHYFNDGKPEDFTTARKEFLSRIVMTEDDLYGIMDKSNYLAYEAGIAYHNAALPEEIRELVEYDFLKDDGKLDIVVATETLAYGLNSNADVVLVTEMQKPNKQKLKFLSVNEYENFIGRAGRLGRKGIGYAYTFICEETQLELWKELVKTISNPDIMESQYKNIWERKESIFYLLNYFDKKDGVDKQDVLSMLLKYPYISEEERDTLEKEMSLLQERYLIKSLVDEIDETEKYTVSSIGSRALGFILSINTYDNLIKITQRLFKSKHFFIFDFLYTICQCEEMFFSDYFAPHSAQDYRSHLFAFLDELYEKGEISYQCKSQIKNNSGIAQFKNANRIPNVAAWNELRNIRKAEALYLWIESYSIEDIKKRCGFEYSNVKKIGEKAKYITDILSADISLQGDVGQLEIHLKRIGVSLYYGIKRELLDKLDVIELEPVAGRQLRTIGRIINIKEHYSKKRQTVLNSLINHSKRFNEEYVNLLEGYNSYD